MEKEKTVPKVASIAILAKLSDGKIHQVLIPIDKTDKILLDIARHSGGGLKISEQEVQGVTF